MLFKERGRGWEAHRLVHLIRPENKTLKRLLASCIMKYFSGRGCPCLLWGLDLNQTHSEFWGPSCLFYTISELLKQMRGDKYLNELMRSMGKAETTYRSHPNKPTFSKTRLFSHHTHYLYCSNIWQPHLWTKTLLCNALDNSQQLGYCHKVLFILL